jgi:hypothetical protein
MGEGGTFSDGSLSSSSPMDPTPWDSRRLMSPSLDIIHASLSPRDSSLSLSLSISHIDAPLSSFLEDVTQHTPIHKQY